MKYELNPLIETFALLTIPQWGKTQKKEAIQALDDFGINGVAFYAAHYSLLERYFAAFASRRVESQGVEYIREMSDELALSLIAILCAHPEWFDDFDAVSEKQVRAAVDKGFKSLLEIDGDIFDALQTSGLSDKAKWQISALLQHPKQKIQLVVEAVEANLPAFEHARAKLEPEIEPLLESLENQVESGNLPDLVKQAVRMNAKARIVPSLASGLGIIGYEDFCVVGLLVDKVLAGQDESLTKMEAILAAKALGDANRIEILKALKDGELYNLEIARLLGLTPATTSHHMNALLSAGFVEGSLKDGKAYYHLCPDGIRRYRDWLESRFL